MDLTEEQKNVIRKDNEDFDEKFNQYKMVHELDKYSEIINKIQKLNPYPTEAITLFFNMNMVKTKFSKF